MVFNSPVTEPEFLMQWYENVTKNVQLLMNKLIDALPQPGQLLGPHQSVHKKAESLF